MGFLLTIHRDGTIRRIPVEPTTADELDEKFATLAYEYLSDREPVPYEPGYAPTPDEFLQTEFELPAELKKIKLALPASFEDLGQNHLKEDPPVALAHVTPGQSPRFVFQTVTRASLLVEKRALLFGDGDFRFNREMGLLPTGRIDALHEGGVLSFRSELVVRRFLPMEEFFVEASNEVMGDFFRSSIFQVEDMDKLQEVATQRQRRQIAQLAKADEPIKLASLRRAAKEVDIAVQFSRSSLVVEPTRNGLKNALDLLTDAYVRGTVTDNMYYASSKRRLRKEP